MTNLEIKIDDLAIQNYDNFIIKHEAAEITYFRYQSHLQNIACKIFFYKILILFLKVQEKI